MRLTKWCSRCRKDNHSDSECWSTRVVPAPQLHVPVGIDHIIPPFPKNDLEALIASGKWVEHDRT
jgi:hypothetical protein